MTLLIKFAVLCVVLASTSGAVIKSVAAGPSTVKELEVIGPAQVKGGSFEMQGEALISTVFLDEAEEELEASVTPEELIEPSTEVEPEENMATPVVGPMPMMPSVFREINPESSFEGEELESSEEPAVLVPSVYRQMVLEASPEDDVYPSIEPSTFTPSVYRQLELEPSPEEYIEATMEPTIPPPGVYRKLSRDQTDTVIRADEEAMESAEPTAESIVEPTSDDGALFFEEAISETLTVAFS